MSNVFVCDDTLTRFILIDYHFYRFMKYFYAFVYSLSIFAPIVCCFIIVFFGVQYLVSFLVLQLSCWGRESFFTLIVFGMSCSCYRSSLFSHGAMGLSEVCDYGIS